MAGRRRWNASPDFAEDPDLVDLIDAIASRYGTDPLSVMRWDPERMGFAMVCMRAVDAKSARALKNGAMAMVGLV